MSIDSTTIAEHQTELQLLLAAGEPFEEIEDWIDELPATEEIKAALWLLAWSEQERPIQRRVALEAVSHLR